MLASSTHKPDAIIAFYVMRFSWPQIRWDYTIPSDTLVEIQHREWSGDGTISYGWRTIAIVQSTLQVTFDDQLTVGTTNLHRIDYRVRTLLSNIPWSKWQYDTIYYGFPLGNIVLTAQSSNPPTLNWTPSAGALGYSIERGGVELENTSETNYVDTITDPGFTYTYRVRGVNANGYSPRSNEVTLTVP